MKPVHCAAVDLGATSGRIIVGTWQRNRLELQEVHRFPNQFRSLAGHDYWDLPYLWSEIAAGLREAKRRYPRLASVGVDGWAVDHVLVNPAGRPVHPVHAYRDARTAGLSAELDRNGLEQVYALTGIPNYAYNTSLQLQETLRACPAIAQAAARCLFVPEYFNFLLSGRMENELSLASHSQLLDVRGTTWSAPAMAFFGVPEKWFSRPALSPQILGPVSGLEEMKGVSTVLVPGHDTACAFTAMPAAPDGSDLYLSSGTWSLLGFEGNAPVLGAEALAARVSNERMGDGRYRPLRSCPGLWLLEQTLTAFHTRPKSFRDWRTLMTEAARAAAPTDLLDVGDPAFFKPISMRDAIDAQLKKRGSRPPRHLAGYVRLICDSLGRGHARDVQIFEKLSGRKFQRILLVGGGSKNPLLCRAVANATGLPAVSLSLEGSAAGNIASQLVALGAVADLGAFRQALARDLPQKLYQPRP